MIPLLLSFALNVDTLSYMYAVPSIEKDTVYIHNGEMCDTFIRVWESTDPTQEIEIVEDIIPYRRRYINSLETASTYQYN
tara:strand:- start:13442 stop:13681 length:240 start_codon:yes stop_codon:yes gene_type:complete